MRHPSRLLLTAVLGTVTVAGCSSSKPPTTTGTPTPSVSPRPTAIARPAKPIAPAPRYTGDVVLRLLAAPDPAGTVPAIALRYLQALQRGEWLAAARLLSFPERAALAMTDPAYVERVGRDVLRNAGGAHLGRCTTSRQLNADAAYLRCGRITVVVHVEHLALVRGVKVDLSFSHDDRYLGAHTHAETALLS